MWNGGKSKIAYKILQNPKTEGGLGLVNLRNKDIALKATWPQILHSEHQYSQVVYSIMRCKQLQDDIWRCRLLPEDVKGMKIECFWRDVLYSWNQYNYFYNFRIENQLLWYNSSIRINNRVFMWNNIHKRGLKYVYQLFENQKYKSDEQVWEEFGLSKLEYNSIKTAMPESWKNFFTAHSACTYLPVPPHTYDTVVMCQTKNKYIYKYISEDITLVVNKFNKWSAELGEEVCSNIYEFNKEFQYIYKLTNITKLRSFQYRLLQRGLVTNINLFKWKIRDSPNCLQCHQTQESTLHMLWECPKVQVLWVELWKYLTDRFSVNIIEPTAKSILLNRVVKGNHVINFICLLTKQYIYRQRCLGKDLSVVHLKTIIVKTQAVEKYIAVKNSRLVVHEKKWGTHNGSCLQQYIEEYNLSV